MKVIKTVLVITAAMMCASAPSIAAAQNVSVPKPTAAQSVPSFAGDWTGGVETPNGALTIIAHLKVDADVTGTVDIPQQGASALALSKLKVAGDSIAFTLADVPGDPTFRGTLKDDKITGEFTQGEVKLPFHLTRKKAGSE